MKHRRKRLIYRIEYKIRMPGPIVFFQEVQHFFICICIVGDACEKLQVAIGLDNKKNKQPQKMIVSYNVKCAVVRAFQTFLYFFLKGFGMLREGSAG